MSPDRANPKCGPGSPIRPAGGLSRPHPSPSPQPGPAANLQSRGPPPSLATLLPKGSRQGLAPFQRPSWPKKDYDLPKPSGAEAVSTVQKGVPHSSQQGSPSLSCGQPDQCPQTPGRAPEGDSWDRVACRESPLCRSSIRGHRSASVSPGQADLGDISVSVQITAIKGVLKQS